MGPNRFYVGGLLQFYSSHRTIIAPHVLFDDAVTLVTRVGNVHFSSVRHFCTLTRTQIQSYESHRADRNVYIHLCDSIFVSFPFRFFPSHLRRISRDREIIFFYTKRERMFFKYPPPATFHYIRITSLKRNLDKIDTPCRKRAILTHVSLICCP